MLSAILFILAYSNIARLSAAEDAEVLFLKLIRDNSYKEAYSIYETVCNDSFQDILDYYRLKIEIELGITDKALESFFDKKWMPFAKPQDYREFFNFFIHRQDIAYKESIISFVNIYYPDPYKYAALLDYAVYLKEKGNIIKSHEILDIIARRKGYSWEKRKALIMLYEIEDKTSLKLSDLKKRTGLCLELRLLSIAEDYIDYMHNNLGLSEFDYHMLIAELKHRHEDYQESLRHYVLARKYITDPKEDSPLHFKILLRYLYLGLFNEGLEYADDHYNHLERKYKAYFLLTKIRLLSLLERYGEAEKTYILLIDKFRKYRDICSTAQLSLASYLVFIKDFESASEILSGNLTRHEGYRQNKLLLKAIIHKAGDDNMKALEDLQNLIGINASSYYSVFAFDLLKSFPAEEVKRIKGLEVFFNSFRTGVDLSYISENYDLSSRQSVLLRQAYDLEQKGIKCFIESIKALSGEDAVLQNSVDTVIRLMENSFFDEAIHILKNIRSDDIMIKNMVFLSSIYLISRHQEPYMALKLAESSDLMKSRNIPFIILPGYLRTALYPCDYMPYVLKYLKDPDISPFFVLAVMREESRFQPAIVSWAGAIGLMQLLEDTALRFIKADDNTDIDAILDKGNNVKIGIEYIKDLYDEFKSLDFVAVAYNAGEKRKRLLYLESDHPLKYFLLSNIVWFPETRHYLRKVWSSYIIYQLVYQHSILKFIKRLNRS